MSLFISRMNKNFSKLNLNLFTCVFVLNKKDIHLCSSLNDSYKNSHSKSGEEKSDKKTNQKIIKNQVSRKSRLESISKFSFISFSPSEKSIETDSKNLQNKFKKPNIENNSFPKYLNESLNKASLKLGKLIDKNNPEKTAQILVDPLQIIKADKNKFNLKQIQEPKLGVKKEETESKLKGLISKIEKDSTNESKEVLIKPMISSSFMETKKALKYDDRKMMNKKQNPYQVINYLNSGRGLFIFDNSKKEEKTKESLIWQQFYQELKSNEEVPPINGFDELQMLTNQGKMWHFPIDNEQGIDLEEENIPFHKHVFLDHYLEKFAPFKPVQEFMILVLNGLSHNSYLKLNEKEDIILWYLNYFNDKKNLINEALEAEKFEKSSTEFSNFKIENNLNI